MITSKKDLAENFFFKLVKDLEVKNYNTITNAAKKTVKSFPQYNWEYFCGFYF